MLKSKYLEAQQWKLEDSLVNDTIERITKKYQ